jgi:hypothetical protein
MPDLRHAKAPINLLHLDDDVDEQMQQGADVLARQVASAFGFPHQQGELLERQGGGVRMHGGDRAGVPRVDVAQVP